MERRTLGVLAAAIAIGVLGLLLWRSRRGSPRAAPTEVELSAGPDATKLAVVTEGLVEPGDGERAPAVLAREDRLDPPALEPPSALSLDDRFDVLVLEYPSDVPLAEARVNGFPTNASGRVALDLESLPSGAMEIYAEATGHCSLSGNLQPGMIGSEPLVLRLPALGRFEGIVRDERGVPLAGASLGFEEHYFLEPNSPDEVWRPSLPDAPPGWSYWGETSAGATCDNEGHFLSSELFPSPRPYDVRVTRRDGAETKTSAGHVRPAAKAWLELVAPTVPMGRIQGTVTFDGKHVEGGVRWKCGERRGGARILVTGDFEDRVPAGEVEVAATAHQGRAASPRMRSFLVGDHATVTVKAGETTRFDLAVEIRGSFGFIGGRVLEEDGSPPPKLLVRLEESQGRFEQATYTDDVGRWRDEVAELGTEYRVSLALAGERFEVGTARVGDLEVDYVLPVLGALPIRVVDDRTGRAISRWYVGYRRRGSGAWAETNSGTPRPDGATTLELTPGEYELWVQESNEGGYAPAHVVDVSVRAGETSELLDVRLTRGFELELETIEVPPVVSNIVLLEPEIWESVRFDGDPNQGGPLSSQTLGSRSVIFFDGRHARVSGLAAGEYRFKAFPPGLVIEPASVVLPRSEPLTIRWRQE